MTNAQKEFSQRMCLHHARLTRGQRRVVDYILRHFDDCAFHTSSQIGKQAGVSETTVIRLANTLNFAGFAEMQKFIRSGLVESRIDRVGRTQSEMRDARGILNEIAKINSENIQHTLQHITAADLEEVADTILAATAICTVGMRSSAATVSYLTAALNQLFGNAISLSFATGDHLDRLRGMPPGTVVIGVSFLRYARHTFDVMRYARQIGLRTIVITDSVTAPLAQFGDILLLVSTASVHFLPSQTAGVSLINALLAIIALRGRDRVVNSLNRFENSLEDGNVFCERN